MNNHARFSALKQRIGGNREPMGYEHTFGMLRETGWHITPPNADIRRIVSELEFALRLDEEKGGIYTDCISSALDEVERALDAEGVLTRSACRAAEEKLLPMADAAKEYAVILCAHAHIDMNWMWSWQETVAATLATFTTMLGLMDEYPDFTFSQSQTSVYRIVEEHDPDMMERIKARIAEGRWEITASAWVETDKNMPTGESLLNTVRYTRDYLHKVWGVDPASLLLDFSPDTFGHNAQIPEIDAYAGLPYCYHCRGLDKTYVLYNYKAPSGATLLMYREPYWYNSAITPHIGAGLIEVCRRMGGLKTGMIVYGVGDHGGGATRRDVERAYEMMQWPVYPQLRFGTMREFFKLADRPEIRAAIPTVDRELNFIFDGCYTTQTRIKRANRMTEASLNEAQALSALANRTVGRRYRRDAFEKAWQNTLFCHFHDIITGSNVQDSREYAMGLFQSALGYSETEENLALRSLSDAIDCSMVEACPEEERSQSQSEGAGVGYGIPNYTGVPNPERGVGRTRVFHLFNPAPSARDSLCEVTVWDWVGDIRRLTVTDVEGNPVEFVLLDGQLQHYWSHMYLRVLVRAKLPAYGYTTVVVREAEVEKYPFVYLSDSPQRLHFENAYILENEKLRAEFDPLTMSLKSLVDKTDGSEKIKAGEFAGLVQINEQIDGMTAWTIGKYKDILPVTDITRVDRISYGSLKSGYRFTANVLRSSVTCEITLEAGASALNYRISVNWNETADRFVPMLALRMPLGYASDKCLCDIPMGSVLRASEAHDIPALTYAAALGDAKPLYLMADSKYGYRFHDGALTLTLLHSSRDPDPDPERGQHEILAAVGIGSASPKQMADLSDCFCHPLRYVPTNPHPGKLPAAGSLLQAETSTARITSVTLTEDDRLLVRVNEVDGEETKAVLSFGAPVKSARLVDLSGNTVGEVQTAQNGVSFPVGPYKIAAAEIEF